MLLRIYYNRRNLWTGWKLCVIKFLVFNVLNEVSLRSSPRYPEGSSGDIESCTISITHSSRATANQIFRIDTRHDELKIDGSTIFASAQVPNIIEAGTIIIWNSTANEVLSREGIWYFNINMKNQYSFSNFTCKWLNQFINWFKLFILAIISWVNFASFWARN